MVQILLIFIALAMKAFWAFSVVYCIWMIIQSFIQYWDILPRAQKALAYLPKWLYKTPIALLTAISAGLLLLAMLVQDSEYEPLSSQLYKNALSSYLAAAIIYLFMKAGEIKSKKAEEMENRQRFYKIK